MTDELRGLLAAQVDDLVVPPGTAERALAGAARARRRTSLTTTAALAVGAVGVGTLVAIGSGGNERETLAAAPPPPADPNAALLVRDGDRVTGSGRIVQVPGRTAQLCGEELVAAIGYPAGAEPPPAACGYGVPLTGVDLSRLSSRREKAGAVEGQASITGTYRNGTLAVEEQGPPVELQPAAGVDFSRPPCDAPGSGWPAGGDSELQTGPYEAFTQTRPGLATMFAQASPPGASPVLVVLARDDAARGQLEEGLRPAYGDGLCVIVARSAASAVTAAAADVDRSRAVLRGTTSATLLDASWQQYVEATVLLVDEAALEVTGRHAPGLIELRPALRPVR